MRHTEEPQPRGTQEPAGQKFGSCSQAVLASLGLDRGWAAACGRHLLRGPDPRPFCHSLGQQKSQTYSHRQLTTANHQGGSQALRLISKHPQSFCLLLLLTTPHGSSAEEQKLCPSHERRWDNDYSQLCYVLSSDPEAADTWQYIWLPRSCRG